MPREVKASHFSEGRRVRTLEALWPQILKFSEQGLLKQDAVAEAVIEPVDRVRRLVVAQLDFIPTHQQVPEDMAQFLQMLGMPQVLGTLGKREFNEAVTALIERWETLLAGRIFPLPGDAQAPKDRRSVLRNIWEFYQIAPEPKKGQITHPGARAQVVKRVVTDTLAGRQSKLLDLHPLLQQGAVADVAVRPSQVTVLLGQIEHALARNQQLLSIVHEKDDMASRGQDRFYITQLQEPKVVTDERLRGNSIV